MIIEIQNKEGKSSTELCICEFQGELEGDLPGNELGKITILEGGKATMDIGLHLLEGSVVTLKLPFIAVEKKKKRMLDDVTANESQNSDGTRTNSGIESSLEVIGVIRKKIIFKTRPKPHSTKIAA